MNIIFLDIDGVITIPKTKFREFHVEFLKKIIKNTNAYIVISSAWRVFGIEKLKQRFKEKGIDRVLGMTPRVKGGKRGEEILLWIKENDDLGDIIKNFVIIDDELSDIKPYFPRNKIVKTKWEKGMTNYTARRAIQILKEK